MEDWFALELLRLLPAADALRTAACCHAFRLLRLVPAGSVDGGSDIVVSSLLPGTDPAMVVGPGGEVRHNRRDICLLVRVRASMNFIVCALPKPAEAELALETVETNMGYPRRRDGIRLACTLQPSPIRASLIY
jgi:hypothetical protein